MSGRIIKADFDKLNKLLRACGSRQVVKVGVFSAKTERGVVQTVKLGKWVGRTRSMEKDEHLDNAAVGAIHEFGSFSMGIPARSWLVMPVHQKEKDIAEAGFKRFEMVAKSGDMKLVLRDVGVGCLGAIDQAFESSGFGRWKPLKPATVKRKHSAAILIESAQFRRSIMFQIGAPS
jgi:hypothetical protein